MVSDPTCTSLGTMAADASASGPIAFIGLGNMGSRMARRLVNAGYEVHGYDLSAKARSDFEQCGGTAAASTTRAVAGADIIVLMLPSSNVVEQVVTEPTVLDAFAPGATVVDMSSSEPERTRALERVLAQRGVSLVDAPVSGGIQRAESGELAIMTGGREADVARAEHVLSVLGRAYHAGPIGAGHAVKALNNLMSATHLLVTSEVILAGQRFGLDIDVMLAIFNASSGRSGSTENKWPNFIASEQFNSGFGLQLMLKDMRIATGLAEQVGSPSELGTCATDLWSRAAGELPPDADHTEIARWLRHRADVGS
jgi:3-hydroxyisobutyrate dehydrogenase